MLYRRAIKTENGTEDFSMKKVCKGYFTEFDGEHVYKIENYDCMDDFFMSIPSASDVWNFCWAHGGITAGRIDCDHAIFPYYTADKVSDGKSNTGSYTAIAKNDAETVWEPFVSFSPATKKRYAAQIVRNIYKNTFGTSVWFEEINKTLELSFRYAWTSSAQFGLVRKVNITNLSDTSVTLSVLDGCRNIMPACTEAYVQNSNSELLDAYKKTDLDNTKHAQLGLFSVSSILSDKAEPNEGLYANTCWFSTHDEIKLSIDSPEQFAQSGTVETVSVIKGKRSGAFICKTISLAPQQSESWYQVLDAGLDAVKIAELETLLQDRTKAVTALEADIAKNKELMTTYIAEADGIQKTADTMTCVHHAENVMFNCMRGGFFPNEGKINTADFIGFIAQRNKSCLKIARDIESVISTNDTWVPYSVFYDAVKKIKNVQILRLFYEYLPLAFSRRHGDPSRPWNRFTIVLRDVNGNLLLNYEGNWRDIFQNWEALAWSYPQYIKHMCAKFVNAMTPEGFNPYRISRTGIDWEIPDADNPWSHIGYWGDHQIIYMQKLLELYSAVNRSDLIASLGEKLYVSANVPYRIKSYTDIVKNPRDTIIFDKERSDLLIKKAHESGSDAKLVCDELGQVTLISFAAKLIQALIAKAANFVPGGGIWLNTQRPEWNDANNALAGYGLSIVTVCYVYRYIDFLLHLFSDSKAQTYPFPGEIADCFIKLGTLFSETDPENVASNPFERKIFTDKAGLIFERERNALYRAGYSGPEKLFASKTIIEILNAIKKHIAHCIKINKRSDGMYHAYNVLQIYDDRMEIEMLDEMLEGQVAVLSSGFLSPEESLALIRALKASRLYEARQHSYILYPNKELPPFMQKNCIVQEDILPISEFIALTGSKILAKDCNGTYHFNPEFRNVRCMDERLARLPGRPTKREIDFLHRLYEKTFCHHHFTGRSGTFYAYEGLGSIYWHMVSKLLLAVQETVFRAERIAVPKNTVKELVDAYYDIRSGLGFNKTPELYGAFPADPYSHTPSGQGTKQPGMTGQVKEEILTRWGELGVHIAEGIASFTPTLLRSSEFFDDGTLCFTWCGTPIIYHRAEKPGICVNKTEIREGTSLTAQETNMLFARNGGIAQIDVCVCI